MILIPVGGNRRCEQHPRGELELLEPLQVPHLPQRNKAILQADNLLFEQHPSGGLDLSREVGGVGPRLAAAN
jgi:hypothetical protein